MCSFMESRRSISAATRELVPKLETRLSRLFDLGVKAIPFIVFSRADLSVRLVASDGAQDLDPGSFLLLPGGYWVAVLAAENSTSRVRQ
jgi:hypothetical protein